MKRHLFYARCMCTNINVKKFSLFSERERARSLYVIGSPSIICLSVCLSVTFVRPTQAIEIFGNVSTVISN